ncbi:MAG: M14 metallopeptidase family protein [Flavobacterium sp.]
MYTLEIPHSKYKEVSVKGRYVTHKHIEPFLVQLTDAFNVKMLGYSVNRNLIPLVSWGNGSIKILIWSQMHGNESTTTKALLDIFNFLKDSKISKKLFKNLTLYIIPILNPDGAINYTRENAKGVDLNRDFLNLSQPESQLLMQLYQELKPDFCFNLHDQRTIFGVGESGKPATVSFLSPAAEKSRSLNRSRERAISVIVSMNNLLQKEIPGQIGRFDDTYNRNCSGDTFQTLNTPTILFEAGHFPNDYEREITRKYIFYALLEGFRVVNENDIVNNKIEDYLKIPQNNSCFFDFVYRNVKINYENSNIISNFAVHFYEVLNEQLIVFEARIAAVGILDNILGHKEFHLLGEQYQDDNKNIPLIGQIADFKIGSKMYFKNGELLTSDD